MNLFTTQLSKILGHNPTSGEMKFFQCFDPETFDKDKRFARYNESKTLFINIDDEHYMYVSNHTNKLRCCLDISTRQLNGSECYSHDQGTIMLGFTKPENAKHLNARINNYHIYLQNTSRHETENKLKTVSQFADHIALIQDETPWERLCAMCNETKAGILLTASARRLLKPYKNGLIYIVPEHQDRNFKNAIQDLDTIPAFIGKTISIPIITLENETANFELPIASLKQLFLLQNKIQTSKTTQEIQETKTESIELKNEPENILEKLIEFVENEEKNNPPKKLKFDDIPDLYIINFPLSSLSFTPNGLNQHTISSIVSLYYRGYKPLALSYFAQSISESPHDIDSTLNVIAKSAKLFGIPMANNCIVSGDSDKLKLFFICTKEDCFIPDQFEKEGDFLCLIGDPNGELKGSAYANVLGYDTPFTPPGVMTATLAALVDVIEDCKNKNILTTANYIHRGGLITALHKASRKGNGATIYSERKGPEQLFIYGEHQAAALVSIKEKHLIDLARITSNLNITSSTIGRINNEGVISVNNKVVIKV